MPVTPRLDSLARRADLSRMHGEAFDVIVIGGGITGAGIARACALKGLRVALVEAADFAEGTSSRSTKLIHGGLRYLAMGEIGLVRETALERKVVHAMAPHLARPRWLLVPASSRIDQFKYRVGITAYEHLGAVAKSEVHRNLDAASLLAYEPLLDRAAFPFGCIYREYLTDDARLVLASLRAAVAAGGIALNHLRVEGLVWQGSRIAGVSARCALSGECIDIRGRLVVNAAGPWVEDVLTLEQPDAPQRLHLSKGIHVAIPYERLPIRHMLLLEARDKRPIFVIPRERVVYVGTTDSSHERGAEWWPTVERDEVRYVLEPVSRYLQVDPVEPEECVAAWAGLRPLIAQPGKASRDISRKDEIWRGTGGMFSIAGGKLTGFRKMADDVLKRILAELGTHGEGAAATTPLPGGDFDGDLASLAGELRARHDLDQSSAMRLTRLYGDECREVVRDGATPLAAGARVLRCEVDWAVRYEGAQKLTDFMYRRAGAAFYDPADREALLEPASKQMQMLLDWSEERRCGEVEATRRRFREDLAFKAQPKESQRRSQR
jgi:glycerol-3-phosphate dehydrogenase